MCVVAANLGSPRLWFQTEIFIMSVQNLVGRTLSWRQRFPHHRRLQCGAGDYDVQMKTTTASSMRCMDLDVGKDGNTSRADSRS